MKKRKFKLSAILACAALILILTVLGGLMWRVARQKRLNQELVTAVQRTNIDEVQNLLKRGADPNARYHPHLDSFWQMIRVSMRLGGATPEPDHGPRAIEYALESNLFLDMPPEREEHMFRIVRLLIEAGAYARVTASMTKGSSYSNLLTWAIYDLKAGPFKQDMIHFLLQHGVDVNGKEGTGWPPLNEALVQDDDQSVKMLLAAGADVNRIASAGEERKSALQLAIIYQKPTRVLIGLLEHGAQVNKPNFEGGTAFMETLNPDGFETSAASVLLAHGANIDAQDSEGDTTLMRACDRECSPDLTAVTFLLKHHARLDIKNHHGQTVLALAIKSWKSRIAANSEFQDTVGPASWKEVILLLKQAGATA